MKPMWALQIQEAQELEEIAAQRRAQSERNRCPVTDSGGAQCTGDASWEPNHQHRWDERDLPT